jgi:hypothetical protein
MAAANQLYRQRAVTALFLALFSEEDEKTPQKRERKRSSVYSYKQPSKYPINRGISEAL